METCSIGSVELGRVGNEVFHHRHALLLASFKVVVDCTMNGMMDNTLDNGE